MNVHFDRALMREAGDALTAWSVALANPKLEVPGRTEALTERAGAAAALARVFGEPVRTEYAMFGAGTWAIIYTAHGWSPGIACDAQVPSGRSQGGLDWGAPRPSAVDAIEWIVVRREASAAAMRLQAVRLALAAPFGAGAEERDVMDLAAELVAQHFARVASKTAPPSVRGHIEQARQAVAEAQDALSPHRCPQSGTVSAARSQLDAAEKALDKAANGAGLIWAALDGSIEHNKRLMDEVERVKAGGGCTGGDAAL